MWADPDQYKRIGACLATERKRLGITQVDLATRLGKPQSFVSAYESGQRRLDLVEFLRLAKALGLDPQTLFVDVVGALHFS